MKRYIEDTVHPLLIVRALRKSSQLAVKKINEIAVNVMDQVDSTLYCINLYNIRL